MGLRRIGVPEQHAVGPVAELFKVGCHPADSGGQRSAGDGRLGGSRVESSSHLLRDAGCSRDRFQRGVLAAGHEHPPAGGKPRGGLENRLSSVDRLSINNGRSHRLASGGLHEPGLSCRTGVFKERLRTGGVSALGPQHDVVAEKRAARADHPLAAIRCHVAHDFGRIQTLR